MASGAQTTAADATTGSISRSCSGSSRSSISSSSKSSSSSRTSSASSSSTSRSTNSRKDSGDGSWDRSSDGGCGRSGCNQVARQRQDQALPKHQYVSLAEANGLSQNNSLRVADHKYTAVRPVMLLLCSRVCDSVNVQNLLAVRTEELENFQCEFAEKAVHIAIAADCRLLFQ
jgi:hypothetical protein